MTDTPRPELKEDGGAVIYVHSSKVARYQEEGFILSSLTLPLGINKDAGFPDGYVRMVLP